MIITAGTATVTNGSNIVTIADGDIFDRSVVAGNVFSLVDEPGTYDVAVDATDNITLTLDRNYPGPTRAGIQFEIFQDIQEFDIIDISGNMRDSAKIITRNNKKIIDQLLLAGNPALSYRVLPRLYIGEPIPNKEFGFIYPYSGMNLASIRVTTENPPLDGNLVLDLAIDGVYQNLNLTLTPGLKTISGSAAFVIEPGSYGNFKWPTIPGAPGSDYYIDITWYPYGSLDYRQDFYKPIFGEFITNYLIGRGFTFPVKSRTLTCTYTCNGTLIAGSDVILTILKNSISAGIITIPQGSMSGTISIPQVNFLTTDTCELIVTQPGTSVPGSYYEISLNTYRIL